MKLPSVQTAITLVMVTTVQAQGDCDVPIRRSRVLSAWQSSFGDGPTCFHNRNQSDEENFLQDRTKSHRFFHSDKKTNSDEGFHWFALQLKESTLITSVTFKGREDGKTYTYNRVIGIEIWTSSWSGQIFSGDHCSCQSMSSQFYQSVSRWTLCGVTNRTLDSISSGENITVDCINGTKEVRHLLVRKNVSSKGAAEENNDDDVMSFADLRLQTVQLATSAPAHIVQNSTLTVSCSWNCSSGADLSRLSSQLQLCSPSGSCTAGSQLQIGRARPEHSGNYTCRLGSVRSVAAAVTVLYPPSTVSITVENPDSCHNLSGVIVQFTSSAAEPVPEHNCYINSTFDLQEINLSRLSLNSSRNRSVSVWTLETHSKLSELANLTESIIIKCSAVQNISNETGFQPVHSAQSAISCQETPTDSQKQLLSKNFVFVSIAIGLAILCFVFVFAYCLLKMKSRRPQTTSSRHLQLKPALPKPQNVRKAEPQPLHSYFRPAPECSYMSLSPEAPVTGGSELATDSASDCTVFLEIVTDGD